MPQDGKKSKIFKVVRIALICVFASVFIVSAVMLTNTVLQYGKAKSFYDDIHNQFIQEINKTTGTGSGAEAVIEWTRPSDTVPFETTGLPSVTLPDTSGIVTTSGVTATTTQTTITDTTAETQIVYSEKFLNAINLIKSWQAKNPDIIGYIMIQFEPGVYISYPICRNDDNLYYTTHASDRSELKSGAIFLDNRCDPVISNNRSSLIFGHNMNDGSMFSKLTKFKESKYFNNVNITIYTLQGIYTYKVFSVHNAKAGDDYTNVFFNSDAEYLAYIEKMQSLSMLSSNMKLTAADQIITLSTCLNTTVDARLAVHAVLISIER
jgi:sortase B